MTDTPPPQRRHQQPPAEAPANPPRPHGGRRAAALIIVTDALPPLAVFFILRAAGVPDVWAYTAGVIVPAGRLLLDRLRGRSFNAVSALVGVFLVVSIVLAVFTQSTRAVMARGGIVYLVLALAFAGSLLAPRPLMFLIMRYFAARADTRAGAALEQRYAASQPFRRATRLVTTIWASAFVLIAAACVLIAYSLPIPAAATATSLIEPIAALALAAWTARYLRHHFTTRSPA